MPHDSLFPLADLVSDPHGTLERMRGRGSVAQAEIGPMVVSHAGVRKLLQDPRLTMNFPSTLEQFGVSSGPFYEWISRSPLNMDGPEHRHWRQLVMRTFTPRSVERLRPYLRAESEALLSAFLDKGRCEFMEEFACQLPALGLCELIGVPKDDRNTFCDWADTVGLGFSPLVLAERIADIDAAITALLEYASRLLRERREKPADDLVTRLSQAAQEGGGFDDDSVAATLAGLVFAGYETTKNQLGWMVLVLSEVPEEWDRVAQDPERAQPIVEEVLRLRSAATGVSRTSAEDVEFEGALLPKGSRVTGSLWSANRDATAFPVPNAFAADENREAPQLAFGHGAHHCLGAALARAELQEALLALAPRIHCPVPQDGVELTPAFGITGPTRLPISFSRR